MRNCPECYEPLKNPTSCRCGWKSYAGDGEKTPIFHTCDYCRQEHRWYRKSETAPPGNRLTGRSRKGGYICRDCYERRNETEFDAMDARIERLYTDHRDDSIGVMLKAAHGKQTKDDRHQLIQWMKDVVKDFGKLPYDKKQRDAA